MERHWWAPLHREIARSRLLNSSFCKVATTLIRRHSKRLMWSMKQFSVATLYLNNKEMIILLASSRNESWLRGAFTLAGASSDSAVRPIAVYIKFKIHEYILLYHKLLTVSWCVRLVYSYILILFHVQSMLLAWCDVEKALLLQRSVLCTSSFNKYLNTLASSQQNSQHRSRIFIKLNRSDSS